MLNSTQMYFYQLGVKNDGFISDQDLWLCEKHKVHITVFTTIHWVKPAWPAEPTLLSSTSLMGAMPGDAHKVG